MSASGTGNIKSAGADATILTYCAFASSKLLRAEITLALARAKRPEIWDRSAIEPKPESVRCLIWS